MTYGVARAFQVIENISYLNTERAGVDPFKVEANRHIRWELFRCVDLFQPTILPAKLRILGQ